MKWKRINSRKISLHPLLTPALKVTVDKIPLSVGKALRPTIGKGFRMHCMPAVDLSNRVENPQDIKESQLGAW